MARKNVPTAPDEELEERVSESAVRSRNFDDSPLDARVLDLEDEADSPFLRGQKRVPVRRGALPRKAAGRVKLALILLLIGGSVALIWMTFYRYGTSSWRFRIESSDDIEIVGSSNVTRAQVMEVMGGDIDRNIFFVPLEERKKQLEAIPWVQSASIMRFLPNHLKIVVQERVPVAFVQINSHIALIDANGIVMEMQPGQQANYSFPVIVGMSDAEPPSTRAPRMKLYTRLIQDLDSGGAQYSHDLSDVDLSDPDDVKATVTDPHGAVLVHLGSSNFLERFKIYVAHVQEWRAQFAKLESIDLRYDHQVIVNPDSKAKETSALEPGPQKPAAAPKSATPKTKVKKHT
jgi:cell division protein FtsQ